MLDRENEPSKEVSELRKRAIRFRADVDENIEQRKQTILKVCQSIVQRQGEFLDRGIDELKPMMIKEWPRRLGYTRRL